MNHIRGLLSTQQTSALSFYLEVETITWKNICLFCGDQKNMVHLVCPKRS
jgi:hypothetical protein